MFLLHRARARAVGSALVVLACLVCGSGTRLAAQAADPQGKRIEDQFTALEQLLPALRHVAVQTRDGAAGGIRLTCEAWFVPGDAVETPVKVILAEADGSERRELVLWLDQGHLFLAHERIEIARGLETEVTERRRSYDGTHLFRLESRSARFTSGQALDLSALPYTSEPLPADAETEGSTLEEMALETASQLAPITVTNRPVRWE